MNARMALVPLALLLAVALGSLLAVTRLGKVRPEEAKGLVAGGARLVDVRTAEEFAAGHLPGAINVPLSELAKRANGLVPKEAPVVVYCSSGMRSRLAKTALVKRGFTAVYDLGAMSRWN